MESQISNVRVVGPSRATEMDFAEAVKYLLSLGPETLTIKLGLRNTELLLQALKNPERSFPSVQIAGTNGKGSTAAFLDGICRSSSIKTGLYTSPHLESITERIKIDGKDISQEDFARHSTTVFNAAEELLKDGTLAALPTFFEQVTATALVAFREADVQLAILETGLGGRLDSTTAANAGVCAITTIAFDHEEYLGHTIEEIAAEKAAIIRAGTKVVIGPQTPEALEVILKRCAHVGVIPRVDECTKSLVEVSHDRRFRVVFETSERRLENVLLGLRGRRQIQNAAIAVQLAETLCTEGFTISSEAMIDGLQTATHPGRLELFDQQPAIVLDGAHNPAGAAALKEFLNEFAQRPLTIVFGAMRDKRLDLIAEVLFPMADELILTEVRNPRTASLATLGSLAKQFSSGHFETVATSEAALIIARDRTPARGMICITGSLYLIGQVRGSLIH
jgi:dihydrofolate synthase/folylpolyglutamate synthase